MATFTFEAVDSKGNKVKKEVDANDREDAMTKIKGMGLYPTKVKEKEGGGGAAVQQQQQGGKARARVLSFGGVSLRRSPA